MGIRVLEVTIDDKGYGGIFAFIMNVMNNINHDEFTLDVVTFEPLGKKEHITKIESYGGKVYECSGKGNFAIKQFSICRKFFRVVKDNSYKIVHIHSDVAYKLLLYGLVAKVANAENIIVHSHSTGIEGNHKRLKNILQKLAKIILSKTNFKKAGCSDLASRWMYSGAAYKHSILIKNGIDIGRFAYRPDKYLPERKKLNIKDNEVVLGTVARFSYQKYPEKLLSIFYDFVKIVPNSKLLWVGDGPLKKKIIDEAERLKINNKIIFYGNTDHIESIYQAIDIFIMTSRFEGLTLAGIEAQASGIPCVCSDRLSDETKVTDEYFTVSIDDANEKWINAIKKCSKLQKRNQTENIIRNGYDIKNTVHQIEKLYKN